MQWCIYENLAGLDQLDAITCTFSSTESATGKERIENCTSAEQAVDIINCVDEIEENLMGAIVTLQSRLNLLLAEQSSVNEQNSVEVLVRNDLLSLFRKTNGLMLGEICYNYLQVDDETLGCKVDRPTVTIFYETGSSAVQSAFEHFGSLETYSPFEDLAAFEFVPYGTTSFDSESGNYTCASEDICKANWIHVSF